MKTVLVIDDESEIRQLVSLSLGIVSDWKVAEAASGREALAMLSQMRPDAILLDIHMPELDGFGTLKLIREEPANRDIPVLIYTADPHAVREENLPEGLAGVLLKPFNPEALKERLEALW